MKTEVTLDYGRTGLDVELPRIASSARWRSSMFRRLLIPRPPSPRRSTTRSARLHWRAWPEGGTDACILICDITRPVPNQTILRPMLEVLQRRRNPPRAHA